MRKLFGAIAVIAALLMAGAAWADVPATSFIDIAAVYPCNNESVKIDSFGRCSVPDNPDVDGQPSGPVTVGPEWLNAQTIDPIGGAGGIDLGYALPCPCGEKGDRSNIVYVANVDIDFQTFLTFTISNGALARNAGYALYDCSKGWWLDLGKVADLVDFTLDPATGGYATMKFKFVYDRLLYPATGAIPAGTVFTLVEDGKYPKASNRPTLLFTKSQILAGPMTIQVSDALDDAGNPLVQPKTGPEVLAKVFGQDQFSAKVQHVADCSYNIVDGYAEATIDVFSDPTRSKFVNNCGKPSAKYPVAEGGYPNGDNDFDESAAHILVVDYGDCLRTENCTLPMVDYGYCVTESGLTFDLTLDSSQENFIQNSTPGNYDGVKLNGNRLYATAPLRGSWTFTNGKFSSIDLRRSDKNELKITVDGTSFLETAEYRVTLALNLPGAGAKTLLSNELAFFWWVNAIKARIPFFILDCTANFNSFVSIGNRATDRAEVWIDGVVTDVTEQKSFPVKSLKPISWKDKFVEPTSVTVLDDCFILNYLSNGATNVPLNPANFYRADLTVYVAVTKDQADLSAQQTNGAGSRTTLHVLYEIGNRSDKLRSYQ